MAYTTINKSTAHFENKLYTGNGGTLNVTGLEFQPDFSWLKCRGIAYHHRLYDALRGVTKSLRSDGNYSEATDAGEGLTAFNSDGYTVIQGSNTEYCNNGVNYASWNWKAGTTGSGNTTGSGTAKTYNYSVNTTAGFSIINYVGNGTIGQQIPHHLGVTPQMIIQKNRDRTSNFLTYHHNNFSSNGDKLNLNDTAATATDTGTYNSAPTSTHVVIGNDAGMNTNNENHIMYCFAEKTGYSKFGIFKGNGNADGTFVYTGFKPNFVMTKKTSGTADWMIRDNKRDFNGQWRDLYANNTNTETSPDSNTQSDLLSNGFKLRMTHSNHNESGGTYIYMAFGQSLVGSNNIPCTAR